MTTAIRAQELEAGYGPREVLRSLTFELPADRISVILGPGGSGKTTLLRALFNRGGGLPDDFWHRGQLSLPPVLPCILRQSLKPDDRSLCDLLVEVKCTPNDCDYLEPCLEKRTGLPWDTRDRKDCPRLLREIWHAVPEAADALLPCLDEPLMDLPVSLARLAALTALVAPPSPPFLLLDEPEAGTEPETWSWMIQKLRQLRGKTVILVTHNLQLARAVADYVMLLIDGEIVEAAEASAFFEQPMHPRAQHFVRMGC